MADRIEIISGRERRRRWSVDEKLRLVAASHEPGACVKQVAMADDVSPSLLFAWRREAREGLLTPAAMPVFLPLQPTAPVAAPMPQPQSKPSRRGSGQIEIELPDGSRVRVDAQVSLVSLRRVIAALRG